LAESQKGANAVYFGADSMWMVRVRTNELISQSSNRMPDEQD